MQPISDELLEELIEYASSGLVTAPPAMCGVSAEVLYDMAVELQQRRTEAKLAAGLDAMVKS